MSPLRLLCTLPAILFCTWSSAQQPPAATAAATTATTANTQAADFAAIRAISDKWKELYAAGRYSEIPDLYTKDTIVLPRGRPRIEGREQMRKAIGGLAAGRRVSIDLIEREIFVTGNHGWVISDFKVTYTTPGSATPPVSELGRGLVIFRRDSDGQWRIHRDMDSPAPMASPVVVASAVSSQPVPPMWNPASRTEVIACDRLAASRYDRTRLAPPVARAAIDVPAAIAQCEADLKRFPGDPRITFHLGRLYGYTGDKQKALEARKASAAAGNHNVIFLLGYLDWIVAKDDASRCAAADQMKLGADRGNYSGQVIYASFFNEGRFAPCPNRASKTEVEAYLKGATSAVDGFFETRLVDHLTLELKGAK